MVLGFIYALAYPNPLTTSRYSLGSLAIFGIMVISWRIFFMPTEALSSPFYAERSPLGRGKLRKSRGFRQLLSSLRQLSLRRLLPIKFLFALKLGFLFGAALALLFAWWMISYYAPSIIFGMAITGLSYMPMFCALYATILVVRKYTRCFGVGAGVQSLVWVGFEYSRSLGVFANPLGISGYLYAAFPRWIQIADLFGVWGLCLVGVLPLALLAELLMSGRARCLRSWLVVLGVSALVIGGTLAYGGYRLGEADGSGGSSAGTSYRRGQLLRVGVVQQDPHDDTTEDTTRLFALSRELIATAEASGEGVSGSEGVSSSDAGKSLDLVVWPETAIEFPISQATPAEEAPLRPEGRRAVAAAHGYLREIPVPHLVGAYQGGGVYRNNAAMCYLPRRGAQLEPAKGQAKGQGAAPMEPVSVWHKSRLVPFIEYNPLRPIFAPLLLPLGFGRVKRGELTEPLELKGIGQRAIPVSTPICFEECFGDVVRAHARSGARMIIAMANDSWAGGDYAAWQQCYTGLLRAVELRLPMLRVTSSGITCAISDRGQLVAMIPAEQPGSAVFEVQLAPELDGRVQTLYMKVGDVLGISCFVLMLVVLVAALLLSKQSSKATITLDE